MSSLRLILEPLAMPRRRAAEMHARTINPSAEGQAPQWRGRRARAELARTRRPLKQQCRNGAELRMHLLPAVDPGSGNEPRDRVFEPVTVSISRIASVAKDVAFAVIRYNRWRPTGPAHSAKTLPTPNVHGPGLIHPRHNGYKSRQNITFPEIRIPTLQIGS